MQKVLKKLIPHAIALALFFVLSTVLFYPELQGKALRQGDAVNHEGMTKDIMDYTAQGGENPNWLGAMFGGMPAYTLLIDGGVQLFSMVHLHDASNSALMIFLAMTGFYLMLLLMRVNPYMAMVGAVGYGLSTYFPIIISAGHIVKMWALQWAPPLIGAIWYAYRENRVAGGALAAFFTALLVGSSHHQITYYFLFVILALVIGQGIMAYKDKVLKGFFVTSAVLLFAGGIGVGSNVVGLYYTADYAEVSTRGAKSEETLEAQKNDNNKTSGLDRDYITAWSYGKAETFNLFIPNFMGGGRDFKEGGEVQKALSKYQVPKDYYKNISSYHGAQPFTEGPVYIGALIVFLAIFALFLIPAGYKWWILAPVILSIILAWGHNFGWFTDFFIDYVPMYSKFRVPSMMLVVVEWGLPLLASLGLCKLYKMHSGLPITYTPKISTQDALMISTAITGGFALIAALTLPSMMNFTAAADGSMSGFLPEDVMTAIRAERADLLRSDALRSLLFVLLGAAAIWLYLKGKIKNVVVLATVMVALVAFDLFGVDRRYIEPENFVPRSEALSVQKLPADDEILRDKSDFRVADFAAGNPFSSSRASYFHRSVGGYHAAKMQNYQNLIDAHLLKMTPQAYDMLNTKYFIDQNGEVQFNPGAIGSAVVIDSVIWAGSSREELKLIGSDEFDPKSVAILSTKYKDALSGVEMNSTGGLGYQSVGMTEYKIGEIEYTASLQRESLVVFSEIYHKDWHVTIDGKEEEMFPVDYLLRGVVVPSGEHKIKMKFVMPNQSLTYAVAAVSTIVIIVWLALCLLALVFFRGVSKCPLKQCK
ncbi:MAG: hypothetical protein R3Y61_04920 [Rikenellaceae bacterium]